MSWKEIPSVGRLEWVHTDLEKPLVESWAAIGLFSVVAAFMMVTSVTTARDARLSAEVLLSGESIGLWIANAVALVVTSVVLLAPPMRHPLESLYGSRDDELVPAMFSPMFMAPVYLVLYYLNVVFVPDRPVNVFNEPASVIAVEEAIVLGVVFGLYSRPVRPRFLSDLETSALQYYFTNWWRGVRLLVAIILSFGLGLMVTMFLTLPPSSAVSTATSETTAVNRQLSALSINTIMTLVPGSAILLYVYLRRKMFDGVLIANT